MTSASAANPDPAVGAHPTSDTTLDPALDPTRPHYVVSITYGSRDEINWPPAQVKFAVGVNDLDLQVVTSGARNTPYQPGDKVRMSVYGHDDSFRDYEGDRQRVIFEMQLSQFSTVWLPRGMDFYGYGPQYPLIACPFSSDPHVWDGRERFDEENYPLVPVHWSVFLDYDPATRLIEPDSDSLSGFGAVVLQPRS